MNIASDNLSVIGIDISWEELAISNKSNLLQVAEFWSLSYVDKFEDFLTGKRIWPDSLKKIENRMYLRLRNSAVFQKYQQLI